MKEKIIALQKEIEESALDTLEQKQRFKNRFLGKEGIIRNLFVDLKKEDPAERKGIGQLLNKLKVAAEERYRAASVVEKNSNTSAEEAQHTDFSLPVTYDYPGNLHPLTMMQNKIIDILGKIGFGLAEGPEIEDEWHNFTALNIPEDHPARDMQDTFFVKQGENRALRTHTSSVQIRALEKGELPLRILSTGRVFRNETISARSHCMFHQIEALYVDEGVSFLDLKETLYYFVRALFGEDTPLRFRASFFPFTEPSAEIDIHCLLCKGKGCNVCKQTGWVELGGAGMVDPNVLINCKIDPEKYTGYAFGLGIERLTMLVYQIPDLRLFTENDVRFLRQFRGLG